jgi:hypothetical protein
MFLKKAIFIIGVAQQSVLTSNISIGGSSMCLSTVQFTCIGQNIPSLNWFLNENEVAAYFPRPGDDNALPIKVETDADLGLVQITSVQISSTSDTNNITSIFITNSSVLEDFSNIQCGSRGVRSDVMELNVSVLGKCDVYAPCGTGRSSYLQYIF